MSLRKGFSRVFCLMMSSWKLQPLALMVCALFSPLLVSTVSARILANQTTPHNVSTLLNNLLLGYDSRLRPGHGGPAETVRCDINIRSMGPISEVDMTYSMDAYFRQTWVDRRLRFQGDITEMAVHIKMLDLIWKPDTYFYNGRGSYLHTTTTPNKLLRIKPDGTVLYSMRVTIKANCPMYLQYFPVDEQHCPLQFGSYAYTTDQLLYIWKHGAANSIKMSKDMRLSQFDLTGHPANNLTVKNKSGEFSTLTVNFRLQRHMGYFLIQVYVPCTLIVVLSWVSFWINREATADRIALGILSVLTLTTLSMDTRDDLPKVPYATALDWFVIMCFCFVTGTLLEFAGVHYFTKIGTGEIIPDFGDDESGDENETAWNVNNADGFHNSSNSNHIKRTSSSRTFYNCPSASYIGGQRHYKPSCCKRFLLCLKGDAKYRKLMRISASSSGVNSVSMIDKLARIFFPLSFAALNILYWIAYTR